MSNIFPFKILRMYEAGCYSTQHKFNSLRGDVSGHVDKDRVKKKKKEKMRGAAKPIIIIIVILDTTFH